MPVLVPQNPMFWADDRCAGNGGKNCSPMSYAAAISGSGITPDTAHQPGLSYVAYLLTGRRHYLDELAAQAGFGVSSAWPGGIRVPANSMLVIGPAQQLRAGAWTLRELMLASLAEPDGWALHSYFAGGVQTNLAWIAADAPNPKKGQLTGWVDGFYGNGTGEWAPWQNDFLALVLEQAVHAQVPNARTALAAMTPFLQNRFLQPANVFSPFNATSYGLKVGPSGSADYTTWSQVQQATTTNGTSNTAAPLGPPPGTWALDYGVAATSVVRALPASAAQQAAMAWINAHPAATYGIGGNANPAWVINP